MDQPLNHHILEDMLAELMKSCYIMNDDIEIGAEENRDVVQATVLSGKEALTWYSDITKRIPVVCIGGYPLSDNRFSTFYDYALPRDIHLCVFNENYNRQIIFQYSKYINFEWMDDGFLHNIENYLPYLKKNKRLEKLELRDVSSATFDTIKTIMDNISTPLKEIFGKVNLFEMLSKLGFSAIKANVDVDTFADLNNFFCLPNIMFEVVEISMDLLPLPIPVNFIDFVSESLSKIKKLILYNIYIEDYDEFSLYFKMLENIENQNFTLLEEVEISTCSGNYTVTDGEDVARIINSISHHIKRFSLKFNVTLKTTCVFDNVRKELTLGDFYKEFKGFKMIKNGNPTFSKTVRVSSKVTHVFVIRGTGVIKL